jgi:hypothetical protein
MGITPDNSVWVADGCMELRPVGTRKNKAKHKVFAQITGVRRCRRHFIRHRNGDVFPSLNIAPPLLNRAW